MTESDISVPRGRSPGIYPLQSDAQVSIYRSSWDARREWIQVRFALCQIPKEAVSIGTNPNNGFRAPRQMMSGMKMEVFLMYSGFTYTYEFEATSGFALFLCLNGHGLRISSYCLRHRCIFGWVRWSRCDCRWMEFQPYEGSQQLLNPYCEYAILP